jgi:hypothetical protein
MLPDQVLLEVPGDRPTSSLRDLFWLDEPEAIAGLTDEAALVWDPVSGRLMNQHILVSPGPREAHSGTPTHGQHAASVGPGTRAHAAIAARSVLGARLAWIDEAGTSPHLLDLRSLAPAGSMEAAEHPVFRLHLHPPGQVLVGLGLQGELTLWDTESGRVVATRRTPFFTFGEPDAAFSPTRSIFALKYKDRDDDPDGEYEPDDMIGLFDWERERFLGSIGVDPPRLWAVGWSPAGQYLFVIGSRHMSDPRGLQLSADWCPLPSLADGGIPQEVCPPPDRQSFALSTGKDGDVAGLAFSPDERALAVATRKGALTRWDLTTRRLTATMTIEGVEIERLCPSSNGRSLLVIARDRNDETQRPVIVGLGTQGWSLPAVPAPPARFSSLFQERGPDGGSSPATSAARICQTPWRPGRRPLPGDRSHHRPPIMVSELLSHPDPLAVVIEMAAVDEDVGQLIDEAEEIGRGAATPARAGPDACTGTQQAGSRPCAGPGRPDGARDPRGSRDAIRDPPQGLHPEHAGPAHRAGGSGRRGYVPAREHSHRKPRPDPAGWGPRKDRRREGP